MTNERSEVRKFFIRLAIFMTPFALIAASFVLLDPFQIFGPREDYYRDCHVEPNRDYASTEMYRRNVAKYGYDSFIFGSSRSRAFDCRDWAKYEPGMSCFHYDAANESLYGVWLKVKYIDASGGKLDRALLIMDHLLLDRVEDSPGHLFMKHPLLSGRSRASFTMAFFGDYFSNFFFVKYLDLKLFGTYRPYMEGGIWKHALRVDPVTNDSIRDDAPLSPEDERSRLDQFVHNPRHQRPLEGRSILGGRQRQMLEDIRRIFDEHGTRYQIVIGPLYDQIPFNREDLRLLGGIFGPDAVHDHSGVNEWTKSQDNYENPGHFRVEVARDILKRVYGKANHDA